VGVPVHAYSLDFGKYGLSELPFAEEVCRHLGIKLTTVDASPRQISRNLINTIRALDAPFGDGVTVPLWLLNRAAHENGHKIVFNGEGGDQLFAGWTNKPLIASSVYAGDGSSPDCLLQDYMRTFHRLYGHEHLAFKQKLAKQLIQHDLSLYVRDALAGVETAPLMSVLRRANLMLKGAQNIQPRASNLSMSFGLKLRSLFCHRPLADWTFQQRQELFLQGSCEKFILKKAVEPWLPQSIVYREKRGMGVPLTEWCTGPLWSLIGRYLNSRRIADGEFWQADVPAKLVLAQLSAQFAGRRIGEILWLMLAWEAWLELVKHGGRPVSGYNLFWPPVPLLKLVHKGINGA
jgi:asparagine synthase (glutamine-hydrolysing)